MFLDFLLVFVSKVSINEHEEFFRRQAKWFRISFNLNRSICPCCSFLWVFFLLRSFLDIFLLTFCSRILLCKLCWKSCCLFSISLCLSFKFLLHILIKLFDLFIFQFGCAIRKFKFRSHDIFVFVKILLLITEHLIAFYQRIKNPLISFNSQST